MIWAQVSQIGCCVWFGSQENPSSQPPLLAALQSEAVSAWPDCHSGVKLKRTLSNIYYIPVLSYAALNRRRVSWSWL